MDRLLCVFYGIYPVLLEKNYKNLFSNRAFKTLLFSFILVFIARVSRDLKLPSNICQTKFKQNFVNFHGFSQFKATKMSSSGEEEETGPSVDSADPDERIAARRLRIQRRLEAQKRF